MAKEKEKREGWIVPAGEKWSYFIGSGSFMTAHTFISSFLSAYLLMIGVSTSIAAIVLLALKLFDSVNDVYFGYILDKVRFKAYTNKFLKWLFSGRYMPWFRLGTFVLPASLLVMFTVNTSAPVWIKITQYALGYLLYDLGFTLISAPYNCTLMTITNNMDERTFIQSYATLGMGLGSLPVVFLGTAFVAGGFGYSGSAIVFSILGLVLAIPAMFFIKERNAHTDEVSEETQSQYTIKEMFRFLSKSKEFLFFELGQLAWGMFYTSGFLLFVAFYIFGDANLSLIYMAIGVVPTIALIPFYPMIFKRISKMVCLRIVCVLFVVGSLAIYFMGPEGSTSAIGVHYIIYAVCSFAYSFVLIGSSMVLPDIAEVVKYRTNTERAGIIFSIHSFVTKMISSLVTSVSLLILGAYGYVSVMADSFEELAALNEQGIGLQTARALEGLWDVTFLYPAIGFALAFVLFLLCKISRTDTEIMMKSNQGEITREEAEALLSQ